MFSIFMPAKPSDRKTETMEELMQKLNDATKQLRDPLLSMEDREQLYDVIDYCASRINTFTTRKTESESSPSSRLRPLIRTTCRQKLQMNLPSQQTWTRT